MYMNTYLHDFIPKMNWNEKRDYFYILLLLFAMIINTEFAVMKNSTHLNLFVTSNSTMDCHICSDRPCHAVLDAHTQRFKLCSMNSKKRITCLTRCYGRNCVAIGTNGIICEGDPQICEMCNGTTCLLVMNYTSGRYKKCKIGQEHQESCAKLCPGRNCIVEVDEHHLYKYRCEVCEICKSRGRCLVNDDKDRCIKSLCRIPRAYRFLCSLSCFKNDHCILQKGTVKCVASKENLPGSYCKGCKFGVCRDCSCHCWSGYGGEFCDKRCNKTCYNGGSCVFLRNTMFCSCVNGFHGSNCNSKCLPCTQKMCLAFVDERNVTKHCEIDAIDKVACYKTCYDQHCFIHMEQKKGKFYSCQKNGGCHPCRKSQCIFVKDDGVIKTCADDNNEAKKCGSSCQRCLREADGLGNITYSCLEQQICIPCNSTRCMIKDNQLNCSRKVCQIDEEHRFECDYICPDSHCLVGNKVPICMADIPAQHYCHNTCVHGTCKNCSCICDRGYIGNMCERKCTKTCYNGGNCTVGNECKCPPGYCDDCTKKWNRRLGFWSCFKVEGDTIEECHARCVRGKCQCDKHNENCMCNCDLGFKGENCSDICECGIGGICRNISGREFCDCINDKRAGYVYIGKFCGKRIDLNKWYISKGLVGGVVAGSVALIVSVTAAMYIFWKKRNVWVLKLIHRFRFYEDDDEKLFDAFVSYTGGDNDSADHIFVYKFLRPMLEDLLQFRLCIHHRDFSPGELIVDNIMWGIEESRRTIMLISSKYVQSSWCAEEYQKAQSEMLNLRHKVIPIFLEDPKSIQIEDRTLHHILESVTYIQWPGTGDKMKLKKFWNQLVYSLPKKNNGNMSEAIEASQYGMSFDVSSDPILQCPNDGSSGYGSHFEFLHSSTRDLVPFHPDMMTMALKSHHQEHVELPVKINQISRSERALRDDIEENFCDDMMQLLENEFDIAIETNKHYNQLNPKQTLSSADWHAMSEQSNIIGIKDELKNVDINSPVYSETAKIFTKNWTKHSDISYLDAVTLEKKLAQENEGRKTQNVQNFINIEKGVAQEIDRISSFPYNDSVTLEKKRAQVNEANYSSHDVDCEKLDITKVREIDTNEISPIIHENVFAKYDQEIAPSDSSKFQKSRILGDNEDYKMFEKQWDEWKGGNKVDNEEAIGQKIQETIDNVTAGKGEDTFQFQHNLELNLTATISEADTSCSNHGNSLQICEIDEENRHTTVDLGCSFLSCHNGDVVLGYESEVISKL